MYLIIELFKRSLYKSMWFPPRDVRGHVMT